MTASDLDRIESGVRTEVDEAEREAAASPWPDGGTADRHVYRETK